MSTATMKQGTHTLTLIGQHEPSAENLTTLHDGYLTDLVTAIKEGTIPSRDKFRELCGLGPLVLKIIVDYAMTLEQMIAAGHYEWKNKDITPEHFPLKGEGKRGLTLEFVEFKHGVFMFDVLTELDVRGLRLGKLEELLALVAAYGPRWPRFSVIAAGSVCTIEDSINDRYVAYIAPGFLGLRLDLEPYRGITLSESCRILAVRKQC